MGFIGSMFSDSKGAGYQAARAPIQHAVTQGQADTSYGQAQSGLEQQQAFLNALAAQGGIGNQSNVFGQQQALANQLQQQALGQGPNPALAQLANATGQNVAQQAALLGSQRGTGNNVGMLARQAGQLGTQAQQGAAGQAAVLQAQQQLAAQQALQQQQAQMAGLATQQVGQQAGALTGYNQMAQNEQQMLLNAIAQANQAEVGMQSNINSANAGIAGINAQGQQQLLGGLMGGIGSGFGVLSAPAAAAKGGMVKGYAQGGTVEDSPLGSNPQAGPQSFGAKFLKGFNTSFQPTTGAQPPAMMQAGQTVGAGLGAGLGALASGLKSAFASKPQQVAGADFMDQSEGGQKTMTASKGGKVKGKAKAEGNSLKNDTVPAMLSPGEIVIPRTHATDPEKAKQFVAAVLARQGMKK